MRKQASVAAIAGKKHRSRIMLLALTAIVVVGTLVAFAAMASRAKTIEIVDVSKAIAYIDNYPIETVYIQDVLGANVQNGYLPTEGFDVSKAAYVEGVSDSRNNGHVDDLYGFSKKDRPFRVIVLPALADE